MRIESLLQQTRLDPRPYQIRIVRKVRSMYDGQYVNGAGTKELAAKSIMIESPTGSGKTAMGLLTAKLEQEINHSMVVWVAMRRNLLYQAATENAPYSPSNLRGKNINAQIHFLSMFSSEVPAELLPANRDRKLLAICDEAHHDSTNSMSHLYNLMQPELHLGVTSTPYRLDRVKLCFEKLVRDVGIRELISQGYLSEYNHYSIPSWEPETVADFYAMDPVKWGKSLIFFLQTDLCRRFQSRLLDYHGIVSDVVTSHTDRDKQLQALQEGKLACLSNCAIFGEGMDFPELQSVFVRDSGRGITTQQGGRVLRTCAEHKIKNIIQSKNSRWPFLRIAMPVQQFLWENDQWMTLKVNAKINDVSRRVYQMWANHDVEIPTFIKARLKKKKKGRLL